jgi:putative ABC transport system permease protein
MQLMLAGVFHLDAHRQHPAADAGAAAAPAAGGAGRAAVAGRQLRGYRIVGTTPDYLALYDARLAQGQVWRGPMQAVLGAAVARATGLKPGDHFAGSHGLGEGGSGHEAQPFEVVGVLAESGSVLDRLVLTDLASVWTLHEHHGAAAAHDDDHEDREITLALVRYRSPLATVMLPRWVNAQPGLQAAAPALETARLMRLVGVGTEVLQGFGAVLLVAALLSAGWRCCTRCGPARATWPCCACWARRPGGWPR